MASDVDFVPTIDAAQIAAAHERIGSGIHHTPVLPSASLGEITGGTVLLKAENLQRVGSFKVRGALNKIIALGTDAAAGVICGSAGNHAQALAFAARKAAVPCRVVMPEGAPVAKVEMAESLGAEVLLAGRSVDDSVALAAEIAAADGLLFVHPFDDPDIICGQGTIGLELLVDCPQLKSLLVPVGGGGLISGIAVAVKSVRPEVEIVAVQSERVAPLAASLKAGSPQAVGPAHTIADGIAVKRPGNITLQLVRDWVDRVIVVSEEETAAAMVLLLEQAKLVVEGAGAVGVAALLSGAYRPPAGTVTGVVLSGGNVDPGRIAELARRGESQAGRRHLLMTRVPDRPGGLVDMLELVAAAGANIVEVLHLREGIGLAVGETAVQLVIETRSRAHADRVVAAVEGGGYGVVRPNWPRR